MGTAKRPMNRPILMGSAPSSGSTLLSHVLGRVPGVYRRRELAAFDKRDWMAADTATYHRHARRWIRRRYANAPYGCELPSAFTGISDYAATTSDLLSMVPQRDSYLDLLIAFMDERATASRCTRWVEKTPGNLFSFDIVRKRRPDVHLVAIVRDARHTIDSLLRRGYSPLWAVTRWYLSNLVLAWHAEQGSVHIVRFEDLTQRPAPTLERLFQAVGIDYPAHLVVEDGRSSSGSSRSEGHRSWKNDPTGPIQSRSDAPPEIPAEARRAFRSLRPSSFFLSRYAAADLTPVDLQTSFGYPLEGLQSDEGLGRGWSLERGVVLSRAFALSRLSLPTRLPVVIRD